MPSTTSDTSRSERAGPAEAGPVLAGLDGGEGDRDALELARVLSAIQNTRFASNVNSVRSTARGLVECAERENATTIVLGPPSHSGISEALLGSTGERVLHHTDCEVAVAPHDYASQHHDGPERIAVAYDGTEQGDAALARACELAVSSGAAIEILVADDPVVCGVDDLRPATPPRTASGVLREAIESVDRGVSASGRVLEGVWRQGEDVIARAISQACESDVDLLITGSRRHGPIDRMILGSVTTDLVKDPPCPVMVVPHR